MFYRKVIDELIAWADSPYRKSLILRGVRQVGKTTAIRMLAQRYDNYIELNLEEEQDRALFISGTEVDKILNLIMLSKNLDLKAGKTLLFIDEIQYSANAMLSLRYFYEKMPELHVVAAGSLLEAYLSKERIEVSVGRVEYLRIYPLDFEEFLQASQANVLLDMLKAEPYPNHALEPLREQFRTYCTIGGMPEAVKVWIETRNISQVRAIQGAIVQSYQDDVLKYTKNSEQAQVVTAVMQAAYFNISRQISFEGFGQTALKSTTVKNAFNLLSKVGLFQLLYPATGGGLPMIPNYKKKPKLIAFDLGIVNYVLGIQDKYYTEDSLHSIYKGNAMEQIVGQELMSMQEKHGFSLQYWVRDARSSSAELDYLIAWQDKLIPIEVKAGKTGTMKSLFIFMDSSPADFAIRLYDGDTFVEKVKTASGKEFSILHLHLGLLTRLFEYVKWWSGEAGKCGIDTSEQKKETI